MFVGRKFWELGGAWWTLGLPKAGGAPFESRDIDSHHAQTKQTADNDLHPAAQSGRPQHGNGEQSEEVVNEDVTDHAEVPNASTSSWTSVAGRTSAGAQAHGEDRGDKGPENHDDDCDDENNLSLEAIRKTV